MKDISRQINFVIFLEKKKSIPVPREVEYKSATPKSSEKPCGCLKILNFTRSTFMWFHLFPMYFAQDWTNR